MFRLQKQMFAASWAVLRRPPPGIQSAPWSPTDAGHGIHILPLPCPPASDSRKSTRYGATVPCWSTSSEPQQVAPFPRVFPSFYPLFVGSELCCWGHLLSRYSACPEKPTGPRRPWRGKPPVTFPCINLRVPRHADTARGKETASQLVDEPQVECVSARNSLHPGRRRPKNRQRWRSFSLPRQFRGR